MSRETEFLFLEKKIIRLTICFRRVTPFSHPSFLRSCYPPCRFFCRSFYANTIHANPSPQTLPFHLPHPSITRKNYVT